MTSISQEWVRVSESMYQQSFIDELASFLRGQKVKTILECGCGGGHILHGLAKKGFQCFGIDSNPEMIAISKRYSHPNLKIQELDWLELDSIENRYDLVMCRGNSLGYVESWDKNKLNPSRSQRLIRKSLELMFDKVSSGGFLYVDTIKEDDVRKGHNSITENSEELGLKFKLFSSFNTRSFHVWKGEEYVGVALSYLIPQERLEGALKQLGSEQVFYPSIQTEKNYSVLCARKII